eukprot:gnl/TRDRNA2_/TRDRNA2_172045_c0_seq3.p1 gnl/TRDRNA2_/TRDRNA2_172045_c0~~gnl/TRDRNA2_/TRDRNA2_172045_c0_seq3.p1  ORF type:complete len:450 (+),score=84.89 gnl/TRDRNA2_/TRDRNA2_172045_c0_seq3:1091-2440(+)
MFVIRNLKRHGITTPMPIQAQALPLVLAGRDVIGLAQTGSGKTLAFLIPAVARLSATVCASPAVVETATTAALVLAPTRELAVQIAAESEKVFQGSRGINASDFQVACLYGGGEKWKQQQRLKWGVHVIVATPGRLLDFESAGSAQLQGVSYLVLDEADRMLDMGFQDDVALLASKVQRERQVLFFSATWDTSVQKLAKGLCSRGARPVRISYGQGKREGQQKPHLQAREGIVQKVIVLDHSGESHWETQAAEKERLLEEHLRKVLEASAEHKVLVFVSQKVIADKLKDRLCQFGFLADAMHGGKSQEYRLWVLDEFRKGKLQLLVCTDVLGRGIDIPSVSHVVIHEMGEVEDYIHRIGRTARGRYGKGHALVFFEYWEGYPQLASELIEVLEASEQHVPDQLRGIADEVSCGKRQARSEASRWKGGARYGSGKQGAQVNGWWTTQTMR